MRIGILRTLCVILFCGCLGMPTISLSYGESTMNNRSALAQEFGDKPGAYDLVIGVSQPIVDPDDRFWVEVYISGYGLIHAAKVLILYSPSAFMTDSPRVRCGNVECTVRNHGQDARATQRFRSRSISSSAVRGWAVCFVILGYRQL